MAQNMGPRGYPRSPPRLGMDTTTTPTGNASWPVRSFDWRSTDAPSVAVVMAMSEVSGDSPEDLETLYDVVDTDALDRLFAQPEKGDDRLVGSVEFEYADRRVVVKSNGRGHIYD